MTRILIADDDPAVCHLIHKTLTHAGLGDQLEIVQDGEETLDQLLTGRFDLAIVDIFMPRLDGLQAVQTAREQGVDTVIIAITGQASVEVVIQALRSQVQDFIRKPFRPRDLVATVRGLLEKSHPSPPFLAAQLDAFLRENAPRIDLHQDDLCHRFHLSPAYATQLLQQHLGMSFRQRLTFHRVRKARELLITTDLPLKQIATQCGFRTPARLTEAFERLEKIPPGQYRQLHGNRP